jgi:hypothetical protein
MNRAQFRSYLVDLFTDSLGVAAEFVVDDAFVLIDQHPEWRAHPQLMRAQLLLALEKVVPSEVPLARLRSSIVEKLKDTDLS